MHSKGNVWLGVVIVLCLTFAHCGFVFKELSVTPANYVVNVTTTYTVRYFHNSTPFGAQTAWNTTTLAASDTVTLVFPNQYSTLSGATCKYSINDTGVYTSTACTVSSNTVTLSNIFSSVLVQTFSLVISNVVNPYPAGQTGVFYGTIGPDTSNITTATQSRVTITSATSSCGFTFNPNVVETSPTNITFTITTVNQFPVDGYIQMQFPFSRKWSQDLNSSRYMPILTGTMPCSSQSGNVNSGIQCTGDIGTAIVTAKSVVGSALAAAQTMSFSIGNFNSPPSNQPVDIILVTTYTFAGYAIDSCNATVSGLSPKTIDSTSFSIYKSDGGDMTVNQQYSITFDVTLTDPMSSSDYITVVFPTGTTVVNFGSAIMGGKMGVNSAASTFSSPKLTVYFSGSTTLQANQNMFLFITNFLAPPSTATTANFVLTILNSGGYPKMVSYQTLTAIAGSLSGTTTPLLTTVNQVTTYNFSITISDGITSSGFMKMIFPVIFGLAITSSCASLNGSAMAAAPVCAYSSVDNSITLTGLNFSSSNIPAQTFKLAISGIANPPSEKATDSISLTTYYQANGSAVDSGSVSGVSATHATIDYLKASVSASSRVNSASGVTYYLSFVIANSINAGGYVKAYFPTSLFFDLGVASSQCQIMINSSSAVSTACSGTLGSSYIFNFTNPFSSTVGPNTNITLVIGNSVTNPSTTKPFSPFSIYTYYSDGFMVASLVNSLSYATTTASAFGYNQLSRVSNTNAAITTYTLSLIQPDNLEANAKIVVTFPADVSPQSNSTCSMVYNSATTNVVCPLVGRTYTVTSIGGVIAGGGLFSISFSDIRNPYSTSELSGVSATTQTSTGQYLYSSGAMTNSLKNNAATSFTTISYNYSPKELQAAINLQLSFELSEYVLMPSYLLLSIDSYFDVTTLSCSSFINFIGSCANISSKTIQISGTFNNSVMGLTVSGFSSKISLPTGSTYTTLISFDSSGGIIDQSLNYISFSLACSSPCKTCSPSNTSACLSCYTDSAITPSIYFYSAKSNCYTICPATTYNSNSSGTLTCELCNDNCYTCLTVATFCTKCVANSTYPYLNVSSSGQICVSSCVAGMYPRTSVDPVQCVSCVTPCATCTTQTNCLTCLGGFYMQDNSTCTSTCPLNTTIPNNSTNTCDSCVSMCLTCSGTTATCTSCASPLVFYSGSCQSSCPSGGTLAPYNGICTPCDSTCLYCNVTITNCTSCGLSSSYPYLVGSKCLSACPEKYYNISLTGQCVSCATAGINCVNCSSASTCLSCDLGFVFLNSTCLGYTPSGYVNISGIAMACTGDCKECSVATGNCTSCKTLNLEGNLCVSNCTSGWIAVSQVCTACTSPCATCVGTLSNCTSCKSGLSPQLYLTGNSCQSICPTYTYPNSSTLTCASCVSPCATCTTYTSCLSCVSGNFLFGTACSPSCPTGYAGVSGDCLVCTSNCKTCSGATNYCLTCNNGSFFLNTSNSCVTNCDPGLFIDYTSQSCVGCASPCKTCANSSSTCTSCLTGYLLSNKCESVCPQGMYVLSGSCAFCATNCSVCTSVANCSSCSGATYLYNGGCVTSCPATAPVIYGDACTGCSTQNCYSCSSADVCLVCKSGFLFHNAQCLTNCPTNYTSNGTHCVYLNNTIIQSITSYNTFPVPFSIAGAVLMIACLMSRLQFNQTYLSGAVYSFFGVLEVLALVYMLLLYYLSYYTNQSVPLWIGLGSLGYLFVLNVIGTISQGIFLCYEKAFMTWREQSGFHKCFYFFVNLVSLGISHKFRNILFCKLFTFKVVSAKLDRVENFRIFNIFSLLSLAHSGGAIFSAAVALKYINSNEQIYYECVDVIVLTSANALMAFFNTHKDKDFFEEVTPEGFSLHKKNKLDEDFLPDKIHVEGHDGQIEEGFLSGYNHALASKAALKFDESSLNEIYSDSLNNVSEQPPYEESEPREYEEISVQAYDIIDEKANITAKTVKTGPKPEFQEVSIQVDELLAVEKKDKGLDLSDLPNQAFPNDSSNFTGYNYFQRVDKEIQGTLDRGVSQSAQITFDQVDMSVQKFQDGLAVDCSIQKYGSLGQDVSIQPSLSKQDMSIQPSFSRYDASIQPSQRINDRSVGMSYRGRSDKNVSAKASIQNKSNQMTIFDQEDEEMQAVADQVDEAMQPMTIAYNDIAIQPTLEVDEQQPEISERAVQQSPELNQMAIQYEPDDEVAYHQFEQNLQNQHTASNIVFDQTEEHEEQRLQANLQEEKEEKLEIEAENIRSYQEELEDRIRQKQKELNQAQRKMTLMKMKNDRRREELQRSSASEEKVELGGIRYVQQRPRVDSIKPPSEKLKNVGKIQTKQRVQQSAPINLQIQSKQLPKNQPLASRQQTLEQIDVDKLNEKQVSRQKTIEQISVRELRKQISARSKNSRVEQKTVDPILVSRASSIQGSFKRQQSKRSAVQQNVVQNKKIEYNQVDMSLSSRQRESSSVFAESKVQQEREGENIIQNNVVMKQEDNYESLSDIELKSEATKKNVTSIEGKNYRVNIQQIDRSLKNDDDEEELDEEVSEREPAGIMRFEQTRPRLRDPSPESDLSGTIEQIPRQYSKADNDKTVSISSIKGQRNLKEQKKILPSKINKEDITSYYSGQISNAMHLKGKQRQIPKDADQDKFHINKFYQKEGREEPVPRAAGRQQVRGNTFALAGRAQFKQEAVRPKEKGSSNPLEVRKKKEQKEPTYLIDQQIKNIPSNNRLNLVKNKQLQNFASHLVLPQESDKQETSFQKALLERQKEEKPISEKKNAYTARPKREAEEIEVHFQAEQFSQDLSGMIKNQVPEIPRTGYVRKQASLSSNQIYNEQQGEADYRGMMLLGQLQQRPDNADLQEYYKRKSSKQRRRRSNGKVDRNTEKIYLQKMQKRK